MTKSLEGHGIVLGSDQETKILLKEQPQACCQQASVQSQSCAELELDSEAVTVSPPAALCQAFCV